MMAREFITKVARRAVWAVKGRPAPLNLVEMIWPNPTPSRAPVVRIADGYQLRQFDLSQDVERYYEIFEAAGIGRPPLEYWLKYVLPGGFFVAEHIETKTMVGAICAAHHPTSRHPCAGHMAWMAVDPAHQGHNLGFTLSSAVTARLIEVGYQRMYLDMPEDRYAAMRIHIKVGWIPFLYLPEMEQRWFEICKKINWPFTPENWPRLKDC